MCFEFWRYPSLLLRLIKSIKRIKNPKHCCKVTEVYKRKTLMHQWENNANWSQILKNITVFALYIMLLVVYLEIFFLIITFTKDKNTSSITKYSVVMWHLMEIMRQRCVLSSTVVQPDAVWGFLCIILILMFPGTATDCWYFALPLSCCVTELVSLA